MIHTLSIRLERLRVAGPTWLLLFMCARTALGQPSLHVDHYTSESGLPQISVKSIAADRFGYIWLATEGGVARFDGRNFVTVEGETDRIVSIQPVYNNNTALPNGRAAKMHAEIGSGGIIRIQDGAASRDTNAYKYKQKLTREDIERMREAFWIHSIPNLLDFPSSPEHPHALPSTSRNGNYYVFTDKSIVGYRGWKKAFQVSVQNLPLKQVFFRSGRLTWLENRETVSELVDEKVSRLEIAGDITRNPSYFDRGTELRLFWNPNSEQAFLYLNGSIYLFEDYRGGRVKTRLLVSHFDLNAKNVGTIYLDSLSGKLFLGSTTQGLFVLHLPQFEVLRTSDEGNANIVYAQLPYGPNGLILTPTGNILGTDPTGRHVDDHIRELAGLNTGDKWMIFRDRDEKLWIRNSRTVLWLSPDGKRVLHAWTFKNLAGAICQDSRGSVWLGVYNEGIYKINPNRPDKPVLMLDEKNFKDVTALQITPDNALLAGTTNGLFRIPLSTGLATLVGGTEGTSIKSIHPFDRKYFWATAKEKGLLVYIGGRSVVYFPADKANYLSSAHCAMDDGKGTLWITTNKGLFQVSKEQLLKYARSKRSPSLASEPAPPFFIHHAVEEGFANNEFNGSCHPCGLKMPNGYLSLPSMDGFVWFKPERIRKFVEDAPILLDRITVNQKPLASNDKRISLPISPDNVEFRFSTPFFGNLNNLDVSYTLKKEGSAAKDADWSSLDAHNLVIRYSSMHSGDYALIVRKRTGKSAESYVYKTVHLTIPPVWYLTTWAILGFVLLVTILIVLGISFYSRYRLRAIAKENERLENLVTHKTNSLTRAMAELEASRTELSSQVHLISRLLASISHDIQSPLNYITHVSADIADLSAEGKYDQIPKVASMVSSISDRTSSMLKDLLAYTKVQLFGKHIQMAPVNLYDLVKEKIGIFEKVAVARGSSIVNHLHPSSQVRSDKQLLSIVIHNLLDNATKYTNQGVIVFELSAAPEKTVLTISNSGDHFPQSRIDFINEQGEKHDYDADSSRTQFTELGLVIVKEVAAMIGIQIQVSKTDMIHFHLIFTSSIADKQL